MSNKIQNKLDQETLSPIFAVFLRILLVMVGLLEDFGDSGPKDDKIPVISSDQVKITFDDGRELPAMDKVVGTDLSVAIRQAIVAGDAARSTLGEQFFDEQLRQRRAELERLVTGREVRGRNQWRIGNHNGCHLAPMPTVSAFNPREPNDLRRFDELAYDPICEQADEIHIDLGGLGEIRAVVPKGAIQLEIDPATFSMQWRFGNGRTSDAIDLCPIVAPRGRFVHWEHITGYMTGYCTPSRHPMTGRDTFSHPVDYGAYSSSVVLGTGPTSPRVAYHGWRYGWREVEEERA